MATKMFGANSKKFSADEWNDALFFEESLFGSEKSFRSHWSRSASPGRGRGSSHSLASTAGDISPKIPGKQISTIHFKLIPDDYARGTNDQKRQKIYDYTEEDCLDKLKTTKNLPAVASLIDALWTSNPYSCPPSYFQSAIDHAEKALAAAKVIETKVKKEIAHIVDTELKVSHIVAAQAKVLSNIDREVAQITLETTIH